MFAAVDVNYRATVICCQRQTVIYFANISKIRETTYSAGVKKPAWCGFKGEKSMSISQLLARASGNGSVAYWRATDRRGRSLHKVPRYRRILESQRAKEALRQAFVKAYDGVRMPKPSKYKQAVRLSMPATKKQSLPAATISRAYAKALDWLGLRSVRP